MNTRIFRLDWIPLGLLVGFGLKATAEVPIQLSASPSTNAASASTVNSPKPDQTRPAVSLSAWAAQVAKLAESGIDDGVVLSFIDSAGTFNLTPNQIISLSQAGVSGELITAMIQHDAEIISGARQVTASTVPDGESPLLALPKGTSPAQTSAARSQPMSPPPANEDVLFPDESQPSLVFDSYPQVEDTVTEERSPIRKPYAVKLTDPIIVFRGQGRMPNTMLLEHFH